MCGMQDADAGLLHSARLGRRMQSSCSREQPMMMAICPRPVLPVVRVHISRPGLLDCVPTSCAAPAQLMTITILRRHVWDAAQVGLSRLGRLGLAVTSRVSPATAMRIKTPPHHV